MNVKRFWLFGLGGFAVLLVLGTVSGHSSENRWRPFQSIPVSTRNYHSPYPWIEVTRRDGQRGYFVYAPVDQVPSDWPHGEVVSQHMLGFWQFVFANGEVAPDQSDLCTRTIAFDFDGGTPSTMIWSIVKDDSEGPADYHLTPAGEPALRTVP